MKLRTFLMVGMLVAAFAYPQVTIIEQNDVDIAWDAVTVPAGDSVAYEVFRATDPLVTATHESVGIVTTTTATISLPVEGDWTIGVRTLRTVAATGAVLMSSINWSNINGAATPSPFVVRSYFPAPAPLGLRVQ